MSKPKCPKCKETVSFYTIICPHCNYDIIEDIENLGEANEKN